tara:strand:- start:4361 stop:5128 length:768 start_codon:yes stop_codon:yes gene_type:complete
MNIIKVEDELTALKKQLVSHKVYEKINNVDSLKIFMENHVYAVWDFMSLLKSLQLHLTTFKIPWTPTKDSNAARFINEIVLEEETDIGNSNIPSSHYEMYIDAMKEIKANTNKIELLLEKIKEKKSITQSLDEIDAKLPVKNFMQFTFDTIATNEPHKIASVFTFGREDLIPNMFIQIVKNINNEKNVSAKKLIYYLERHIELDGDDHGPIALKMISNLCGDNKKKWDDVIIYSKKALKERIKLWDHILYCIEKN